MPVLFPRPMATCRRCCARRKRPTGAELLRFSIRSSIRSISASSASLGRYAELRRRLARGGDPDGHGQPDRTDRRRLRRHHRGAARHLLRAPHPQRAGRPGQPAYPPHDPRARCGAAPDVRGARGREPAQGLRQRAACSCTTASRFPIRRARSPSLQSQVKDAISASRSPKTASTSITATVTASAQDAIVAVCRRLASITTAPHAFYLGTELMKAEIAWRLGKRYAQDEPLDWGCAVDQPTEDLTRLAAAGHTLRAAKR